MIVRSSRFRRQRGVVLVVVVALLGLLAVLVLSLNALVRLDVQLEVNRDAHARARAQARAALEIAVGQLQRFAGPDARATAAAGEGVVNAAWIGVWSTNGGGDEPIVWLVSGNERDPLEMNPSIPVPDPETPGVKSVWLLNRRVPSAASSWRVKLPPIDVRAHHPGQVGPVAVSRFAYWIGDESLKLSVGEPPGSAAFPNDFPKPRLDAVFGESVPAVEHRARVLLVDQAGEAGFDRRIVRDRWLELTAMARTVSGGVGEAELLPMAFNLNSSAGPDVWRAILSSAESALPSEVRDDPEALDRFYNQLLAVAGTAHRPFRSMDAFVDAVAAVFPPESDVEPYWSRLQPVLTVRGDTYLVRAYGEACNPALPETAPPLSRAWLEALVQRIPDPHPDGQFGRAFRVVGIRWLSAEDV